MLNLSSIILIIFIKTSLYEILFLILCSLLLSLPIIWFFIKRNSKKRNMITKPNIPAHLKNLKPLIESVKTQQSQVQVPQQNVQQPQHTQQAPQSQKVAQEPVQPVQQVVQAPVQTVQQPVQQVHENRYAGQIGDIDIKTEKTYVSIGNKQHGIIEIDLISNREKGRETRYLDIQIHGWNNSGDIVDGPVSMAITSKEEFETLKKFFSTLSWED